LDEDSADFLPASRISGGTLSLFKRAPQLRPARLLVGVGVAVALSAASFLTPASASVTVADASNLADPITGPAQAGINSTGGWELAQTFTALHSGEVSSATAVLTVVPYTTCNINVSILNVNPVSGKPTSRIGDAAASTVSGPNVQKTVTFAGTRPSVVAGTVYALSVRTTSPLNSACAVNELTWATTATPYAGGTGWKFLPTDVVAYWTDNFNDALFAINVDTADPVLDATLPISGGELGYTTQPSAPVITPVTLNGLNRSATATLPISVSDARGTGAGWNVQLSASQFSTGGATPRTLPASAVSLTSPGTATCDDGVTCAPAVNNVLNGVLGSSSVKIFSAGVDSGMGNQGFTPTFNIDVPAKSYRGTYHSTWVVSLVTGP
jgi:hypothetical protein